MKRILAIAALLMVSCGGNQTTSESKTAEENHPRKVSEMGTKSHSHEEATLPKRIPSNTIDIRADKDSAYIEYREQLRSR